MLAMSSTAAYAADQGSLKAKSNEEILQAVLQSTDKIEPLKQDYTEDRVTLSPLDRLWEMPAQEAALAFAYESVSKEAKDIVFKIDDPSAKPPPSGEVGIRWVSGNEYAPPEQGVTILKFDGYQSALLTSEVQVVGAPSKEELQQAVMKTDLHPLRKLVAQQTFEILWWLKHVRIAHEPKTWSSGSSSSADDIGVFWMKPGGPETKLLSFGEPCGQCLDRDTGAVAPFASSLLRRLAERSGIKHRYPLPKVGVPVYASDDAKFVATEPPPNPADRAAVQKWVGRLLDILKNPQDQGSYSVVLDHLVPASDPLRYKDARINAAVLDVFRRANEADAKSKAMDEPDATAVFDPAAMQRQQEDRERRKAERRKEQQRLLELSLCKYDAATKLALRDVVESFPELMQSWITAAALLAERHPELRSKLLEHLQPQIAAIKHNEHVDAEFFTVIWNADLRQLDPLLESLASAPPSADENHADDPQRNANVIRLAWHEPDALTRTKLNIIATGYVARGDNVPERVQREFAALSENEQLNVCEFVDWLRSVEVPWSRRYIENLFTPHTPRPDIAFER